MKTKLLRKLQKKAKKKIYLIRTDKEDMEEKNLKPFDLQKAREGKPVCTRDGRKARIICFDRKYLYDGQAFSIVALVNEGTYRESVYSYTKDGLYESGKCHNHDLMMLPEKKEGWVNVYKNSIYRTKEEAFNRRDKENYLMTIKVDYKE